MGTNDQMLATFQTRVRDLLARFQTLKQENEELYAMIGRNEEDIRQLREQLTQAGNDYNALKMARMMQITDGDLESAKARVASLIREVEKCITILTEG